MLNEMPYDELLSWVRFFDRRPVGWREDLRTYHLMRTFGEKRRAEEVFPSLQAVFKRQENPVSTLRGSYMHKLMTSAVGGDKLKIIDEL